MKQSLDTDRKGTAMTSVADYIGTGSISHGTLREEDLVPCFLDTLDDLAPERAEAIRRDYATEIADPGSGTDDVAWLMHTLYDALDECAPTGMYFGASEGDGSDFGFWEID